MYAQVNQIPIYPDKIEEGIALWQERLLVAYRAQPGFRGATLLNVATAGSGPALLILFWDTAADSEASAQSPAIQEALLSLLPLFSDGIDNEDYTVISDERIP